ncbi:MAG: hypothetical protein K9I36_11110 [Bacteroidia bacterium]|nr:hypothetical protein [Bacteroidia bacterium]MCF8427272.1 hypothetical protein [Bacteroidia bacterium]
MKKLFYLFIPLLIVFSTSTSCKKKDKAPCSTPDTAYIDFYPDEEGKIPYTGFDTLTFKNEASGIVHTFIGQGIDTSLTYYQVWFPDMCPEEFQKCKSNRYKYVSETFQYPIFLHANLPYGENGVAYLTIRFEGVDFSKSLATVGFKGYTDTINGQIYSNINDIDKYFSTSTDHIKYNIDEGILQVVYNNKIYSKQK